VTKFGVLVLAAGLSSRLDGPNKLLMPWRGKALVSHVLALAEGLPATKKVLVTHRDDRQICDLLADAADWTCAFNEEAASGMASSLLLGLAHLDGCASVLVLLGDMPDIAPATLDALIAAATQRDFYAIVPVYQGQWGNPVILGQVAMRDCAHLKGDQGARRLLLANQDRVLCVDVDDPAVLRDFDLLADFVAS
jgi:molybdenum cofactor cytidylyltransferase